MEGCFGCACCCCSVVISIFVTLFIKGPSQYPTRSAYGSTCKAVTAAHHSVIAHATNVAHIKSQRDMQYTYIHFSWFRTSRTETMLNGSQEAEAHRKREARTAPREEKGYRQTTQYKVGKKI